MADIFRGPLLVGRRDQPVQQAVSFPVPSLLVTTLAVVVAALPVGEAQCTSAPVHRTVNANTSLGTPKTLTNDKQLPFFVSPHFLPNFNGNKGWLNPDTSKGTAKPLYFDSRLPFEQFSEQPHGEGISRARLLVDTSRGQPITLQAIVLPSPIVNQVQYGPVKFFWQPDDTSVGSAKGLIQDNQLPVQNVPVPPPDRVRPVTDTSQSTEVGLFPIVVQPIPPGETSFVGLQKVWWQPADTSKGTAKGLTADNQLPIQNYQHTAPDRIRPVVNTSRSSYGTVYPVVVVSLPVGKAVFLSPQRYVWQAVNTSQSGFCLVSSVGERAYTFTGFTFIAG